MKPLLLALLKYDYLTKVANDRIAMLVRCAVPRWLDDGQDPRRFFFVLQYVVCIGGIIIAIIEPSTHLNLLFCLNGDFVRIRNSEYYGCPNTDEKL